MESMLAHHTRTWHTHHTIKPVNHTTQAAYRTHIYHTCATHKQQTIHTKHTPRTFTTPTHITMHNTHAHHNAQHPRTSQSTTRSHHARTSHAQNPHPLRLRLPSAGAGTPRFMGPSVKVFLQGRTQQPGPLCYDHCTLSDSLP